jgi:tripartite-type tricarboxylate transporter receptor subunit TctC
VRDFVAVQKLVSLPNVPYKGGGAVMPDVIAGRVNMSFATLPSSLAHVQSGKLRALGVSSKTRSPTLPDLPTIAEAGVPGYDAGNWIGLFAPAKTPRPVVVRLDSVFKEVIQAPETKAKLLSLGFEPDGTGTREFTATVAEEIAKWRKLIAQSGAKPQ